MNRSLGVPSKYDEAGAKGVSSSAWVWIPRHWLIFWMFALCGMLLVLALLAIPLHAQLSPGPLSKAHHAMDGPAGCVDCHAVSPGSPTFRCLDCHQEIATHLLQKRGLHPIFMAEPKASCVRCHSEHNGNQFVLVRWDPSPEKFDHSKTGFRLDGKHAGVACINCHTAKNVSSAERATIKMKDVNHSYFGLSKNCTSCHEDKHKGRLGSNCLQCHNSTDWKDTRSFDHGKTKYALTGAHTQVKCALCHTPGTDGVPNYVGLKFDRCATCHNDVHEGEFKQSCESCHSTASWKRTKFVTEFDHSKTKYPLQGKHQQLSCLACHRNGDFKTQIAYSDCRDCHKADPHSGQFLARADGGRCETCHTVTGFKPAKYTVADHRSTKFALQEKHVDVECAKCHTPAGKATIFVIKVTTCISCHKDVHHGQFSGPPNFDRCEQCHNQTTFHAAGFDLARHQKTRFVLTGGHIAVACNDCHKPATADGKNPVFHFDGLSCATCHNDPHKGQFSAPMQLVDSSGKSSGCEACHSTKSWSELANFNHDNTKFKLTGTHQAVECAGCHRPPNMERKLTNVDYHAAPTQCEECHQNVHGPQFVKTSIVTASATHCADCHTTTKWRPSLFDHEKTTFSLTGAHQNVRCGACHKETEQIDGKAVVVYKLAPSTCAACHGNSLGNRAT